jgi:hypothetical protein
VEWFKPWDGGFNTCSRAGEIPRRASNRRLSGSRVSVCPRDRPRRRSTGMKDGSMSLENQIRQLEAALAALESQRAVLGDDRASVLSHKWIYDVYLLEKRRVSGTVFRQRSTRSGPSKDGSRLCVLGALGGESFHREARQGREDVLEERRVRQPYGEGQGSTRARSTHAAQASTRVLTPAVPIEAVKEQRGQIQGQQKQIEAQREEIQTLRTRLSRLESLEAGFARERSLPTRRAVEVRETFFLEQQERRDSGVCAEPVSRLAGRRGRKKPPYIHPICFRLKTSFQTLVRWRIRSPSNSMM